MFKKLKDKIAEEVKQSPLRLPTSVQQHLSQYSPFTRETHSNGDSTETQTHISGNRDKNAGGTQETLVDIAEDSAESAPNQFSIADNDSRSASPGGNKDDKFQPVNLNEPKNTTSTPQPPHGRLSRQSSLSSVFSDVSFLPGSNMDSTYHPYHFQSDLESNVSEFDESASQTSSSAVDRISKEHIFNAYQKMRMRYHKYKGRYSDLARHYKELEREREKVKHVLTETQDRSLRRISELKEQCALEQQAKAHLEENLRSDLEEKDNLITVLQTKVKLLASPNSSLSEGLLVDLANSNCKSLEETDKDKKDEGNSQLASENEVQLLKEKLQRFESLLIKCKENIKNQIERNNELQAHNELLKNSEAQKNEETELLQKTHRDQLAQLTESLNMARKEIETLRHQEQEAALAAAETKQKVHAELLKQEEEMIRMRAEREQLHNKVLLMDTELKTIKEETAKQLQEAETVLELEKQKLLKELSRGKTEALKLMDEDMDHRLEDLKKEKDAYWEATLQKRLSEEINNHARTLRQTEEHYRARLAELAEEKVLALEEKELHCASLIVREQNNQQKQLEEFADLKNQLEAKEKMVDKIREEVLEERRSWVQQIEDNRQRHLEEIQSLTLQNKQMLDELEVRHSNSIDAAVLELKQQHTKELEKIQLQHEELLQAANEDMELSAKNQIEQLRTLLRDKESELSQRSAIQQEIHEQLRKKDINITDLGNEIKILQEQLDSMNAISDQLNTALEQANLVEPLNRELEKTKTELNSVISSIRPLEEETNVLKLSSEKYQDQACKLQDQLEESKRDCGNFRKLVDDLNHSMDEKKKQLTSLEQETSNLKDLLDQKEKSIVKKQTELEATTASTSVKELEWQRITEGMANQLHAAQAELETVKLELVTQAQNVLQLEHAQSEWYTCESHLKRIVEEKDGLLASKDSELDALKQSLNDHRNSASEVLEQRSQLDRVKEEIAQKLANTKADLLIIQQSLEKKEEEFSELLQEKQQLCIQLNNIKSLREQEQKELVSSTRELEMKQSQLEEIQNLLVKKEKQIVDVQLEIEMSLNHSKSRDSEYQAKVEELNTKLEKAQVEFDVLKTTCDASSGRVEELELVHNALIAEKFKLQSTIEEKEKNIASQELDSENMLKSLEVKDQRITELQEEIVKATCLLTTRDAEWEQKTQELSNQLATNLSELEEFRTILSAKNERILELEQAQKHWTVEASLLEVAAKEHEVCLDAKKSEIESLGKSLELAEQRINELEKELQHNSHCLNMQDSELKQEIQVLSESLKTAKSELHDLEVRLVAKEDYSKQQEFEFQTTVEQKDQLLLFKESELNERQRSMEVKDQQIDSLQDIVEKTNLHSSNLTSESEKKMNDLSVLLDTTQSEMQSIRSTLQTKEFHIQQLEQEVANKETLIDQLAASKLQLNTINQSLCDKETLIAKLQFDQSAFESSSVESSRLLAEKEAEFELVQLALKEGELRYQDLQAAFSKANEKLESLELELQELRLLNVEQESKINSLEGSVEGATQHSALKDSKLDTLNHSLAVKESVILDLQGEVERNGQLLYESETLVEEQRQQLKLAQQEKDELIEQLKNQQLSGESQWQSTLADLNDRLSVFETSERELRLQLVEKEDKIQEMMETQKRTDDSSVIATSAIDCAVARAVELEVKLLAALDQVSQKDTEKKLLEEECAKLKENLESSKDSTGSMEQMENQIKILKEEMSTLVEEKSRLELLCKRFKVQLADTRKLLAATKITETTTAKDTGTPKSTKEESGEAKMNYVEQAEQNENQLKNNEPKELLQQQCSMLQRELDAVRHQHKMEVSELRRLVELGKQSTSVDSSSTFGASNFHGSLEEATELEYLRNILFEYMMGRQPATLAKVVAAIVKFTPEQTRKITEREEQRQSLLGHLGFA